MYTSAEAAIRAAQKRKLSQAEFFQKANFDPSQPRNRAGEWSKIGAPADHITTQVPSNVVTSDGFCRIVKNLCILEATETLPTGDYGATYFRALNACMDRYGCLGRA